MKGRVIFLLEEPSMKILLDGLLPRIFPGLNVGDHFLCVPHEGKSDLDRSIPRKLGAWREPGARFVIVRDNDNANCIVVKENFQRICHENGRPETLVRLVCQELESWYIGDLAALATAFSDKKLQSPALRKRFATPDTWQKPSAELHRLIPTFQKGSGARAMASCLSAVDNRSASFNTFARGVQRILIEMGYQYPP